MFGILRPCRHTLPPALHADWVGHLCGVCLALRDEHGHLARTATNLDGLVVSVLVEAQRAQRPQRRRAGPCALRGLRTADVARGDAPRLAAVVSLVLAAAKVADHAVDGDGALRHRALGRAAERLARRWSARASAAAGPLGLDVAVLLDAVARQPARERGATDLLAVTEPTETATAAALAHTAVLAGTPANAAPLAEAGRLFGRLAHVLDAVADLDRDTAAGAWNPLTATGTDLAAARRICEDALLGIRLALADAALPAPALVHRLLVHELRRSVAHAFAHPGPGAAAPPRGLVAGCGMAAWLCCTCQVCCREHYEGPWSRKPRDGWCRGCDGCSGCDGCDGCCDCCRCCD